MKSLKVKLLESLPDLKDQSLKGALSFCEKDQRFKDICFNTRETIFALLKQVRGGDQMIRDLKCRADIQTTSDCVMYLETLVEGVKWNYVVDEMPVDEDDEDADLESYVLTSRGKLQVDTTIPVFIPGPLPSGTLGVLVETQGTDRVYPGFSESSINGADGPNVNFIAAWDIDDSVAGTYEFKRDLIINALHRFYDAINEIPMANTLEFVVSDGAENVPEDLQDFQDMAAEIHPVPSEWRGADRKIEGIADLVAKSNKWNPLGLQEMQTITIVLIEGDWQDGDGEDEGNETFINIHLRPFRPTPEVAGYEFGVLDTFALNLNQWPHNRIDKDEVNKVMFDYYEADLESLLHYFNVDENARKVCLGSPGNLNAALSKLAERKRYIDLINVRTDLNSPYKMVEYLEGLVQGDLWSYCIEIGSETDSLVDFGYEEQLSQKYLDLRGTLVPIYDEIKTLKSVGTVRGREKLVVVDVPGTLPPVGSKCCIVQPFFLSETFHPIMTKEFTQSALNTLVHLEDSKMAMLNSFKQHMLTGIMRNLYERLMTFNPDEWTKVTVLFPGFDVADETFEVPENPHETQWLPPILKKISQYDWSPFYEPEGQDRMVKGLIFVFHDNNETHPVRRNGVTSQEKNVVTIDLRFYPVIV